MWSMVRILLPVAGAAVLAAGCGGADAPQRAAAPTATATPPEAAELVWFQRQGFGGATQHTITVLADGTAEIDRRHGGAGARLERVRLDPAVFSRLRRILAHTPVAHPGRAVGTPPSGASQFMLRLDGEVATAREGAVPRALRPAVGVFVAMLDGEDVRVISRRLVGQAANGVSAQSR
jgi:hypothetical protein